MVKITIDRSTGTTDPGRITQRILQPGTLSPGGTAGGEKLRKTQENIGFAIAEKQKKIVENNYLANSRVNVNKKVLEVKNKLLSESEDPIGFADNFSIEIDKVYDDILRKAPTDSSRASLQNVFAQQKISNYQQAVITENKILAEKVINDASNNIDQLSIDIFDEPASFQTRLKDIDSIVDSTEDVLSPVEREKFEELAKKRITDFYVKGLIDKLLGEADIFVNSDSISDIFSADEVLKYRDAVERKKIQVNNELIKQRNSEEETLVLDRELGIFRGTTSQLQLDEDFEKGSYGIKEYIGLSNKLRSREDEELKTSGAIIRVDERQKLGLPFDTTDSQTKKDLNTYFNTIVTPIITEENQDQLISTFVSKFTFIPDVVKSNLLAGLHNGTDDEIVRSSRLIESLTSSNPQLSRQFSTTSDLARARTISSATSAGMPTDQAVKAADNMIVQKNTVEQEQKKKEFRDSKPEFDQDEITSFFVDDPNTVPASMKSDWRVLYENYATNLNMSLEDAKTLSYKIINSQWGVSTVTGTETYIKYAPEKYYNKQGLDPIWMEEQLREDVTLISSEIKDYDLNVDPDTIGTETPGYFVNYISKDGIPLIARDENNDILLWRPDINTSKNVEKQIKDKEESFKDIRTSIEEIQVETEELLGLRETI